MDFLYISNLKVLLLIDKSLGYLWNAQWCLTLFCPPYLHMRYTIYFRHCQVALAYFCIWIHGQYFLVVHMLYSVTLTSG